MLLRVVSYEYRQKFFTKSTILFSLCTLLAAFAVVINTVLFKVFNMLQLEKLQRVLGNIGVVVAVLTIVSLLVSFYYRARVRDVFNVKLNLYWFFKKFMKTVKSEYPSMYNEYDISDYIILILNETIKRNITLDSERFKDDIEYRKVLLSLCPTIKYEVCDHILECYFTTLENLSIPKIKEVHNTMFKITQVVHSEMNKYVTIKQVLESVDAYIVSFFTNRTLIESNGSLVQKLNGFTKELILLKQKEQIAEYSYIKENTMLLARELIYTFDDDLKQTIFTIFKRNKVNLTEYVATKLTHYIRESVELALANSLVNFGKAIDDVGTLLNNIDTYMKAEGEDHEYGDDDDDDDI